MIFTKKDLKEKLELSDEKAKIIMTFQKKLSVLTDDGDGFSVNGRNLHEQLGVGRDYSTWIKSRISKYNFIENEDYEVITKSGENLIHQNGGIKNTHGGDRKSIEYMLTLDMAKQLSMIENNENGRIARIYFIIMEKALKDMVSWKRVREPQRETYKVMCKELDLYLQRNKGRKGEFYDYTNEANALNLVCLGSRAKDILAYFDAKDKNTRDHLIKEYNMYLDSMQNLNIMYLRMNIEKELRYNLIQQGFKVTYPNATFVIANKQKEENLGVAK